MRANWHYKYGTKTVRHPGSDCEECRVMERAERERGA